jgi:Domain of unknown function (DUF4404)
MSADPERLQVALDELHRQLAEVESLDLESRNRLTSALHEIQTTLRSNAAPSQSLLPRLRETAIGFEESHPRLAAAIGSLIDALARVGI